MNEAIFQIIKTNEAPALLLDLDALKKNAAWVLANSGNKKIRIATKSIRSVDVLKKILNINSRFSGLMTFTLSEALWLRSLGFNDILMGYPSTDIKSLNELAKNPSGITLMVDSIEHLNLLNDLAGPENTRFDVCLDVDLSLELPKFRFGVYRSPIKNLKQLETILDQMKLLNHVKLIGIMGYEAQIAGVPDKFSPLVRLLKKLSVNDLRTKRFGMFNLLKQKGFELNILNGGGTGSLITTSQEEIISEITVGSAFYAPTLFDQYEEFKLNPALHFALPVVRRPEENMITLLGGGYIASGAVGKHKQPLPVFPKRLKFLKHEGAGEVQTPLLCKTKYDFSMGDPVFLRPAKAGEICERFNEILLIQDNHLIGRASTYRGEGKCFL